MKVDILIICALHCCRMQWAGLDCSVHVPSDQCVLTNDCDDGVFINTLKHITEVSHHDGCHLYHLPATAALINLFTHVNIITGILHQQELGYFCAKYFMGPSSRCAAVKWFITRASMKWFITRASNEGPHEGS